MIDSLDPRHGGDDTLETQGDAGNGDTDDFKGVFTPGSGLDGTHNFSYMPVPAPSGMVLAMLGGP
ncbi:MAG: hypothetical protein ACI89L_001069 [Phycisphaerales bacterium]